MAVELGVHLGCEVVPEFGRIYCEAHGTDSSMADLLIIGQQQAEMTRNARLRAVDWTILDTDPVTTAAWAQMIFGRQHDWFLRFAEMADLYLLMEIDLPWVADGLRLYAAPAEQRRFFDICRNELERRNLNYALINGRGMERFHLAVSTISTLSDNRSTVAKNVRDLKPIPHPF